MKITVTLTNKQLTNKEFLIAVRAFVNGKYKHYSVGVSCTKSNWNANTSSVSSRDRAYKEKNAAISAKLQEVTALYNNVTDVQQIETNNKQKELSLFDIIDLKIADCNTYSYKKNFIQLKNFLNEEYNSLKISSIDNVFFADFIQKLRQKKSIAQQNKLVKMFNIVYKFALENSYINNYNKFKYNKQMQATKERYLTATELNTILTMYRDSLQYYNYLGEVTPKQKAVFLFILHLAFQGIAPCDMANLRVKDLEIEKIQTQETDLLQEREKYEQKRAETVEILNIKLYRQKTKTYVNIITYKKYIQEVLDYFTQNKTQNDYLIDCLNAKKTYTEKQKEDRISNYYNKLNKSLNAYYKEICEKNNLTYKHITYYMARHTFINKLYSMQVPENTIKRLIGHKDSTLQRYYIADVQKIEQANIIKQIFEKHEYSNPFSTYMY